MRDYPTRYATADEFEQVIELDGASFGIPYGPDEIAAARLELPADRILVAVDGARVIAISAELPCQMTLPGGGQVSTVGLSWVSVELTYRRQGVLRSVVEQQLRAAAADGVAAVVLNASEGGIYGRYGFGVATPDGASDVADEPRSSARSTPSACAASPPATRPSCCPTCTSAGDAGHRAR